MCIASVKQCLDLTTLFYLPLSAQAFDQFTEFQNMMMHLELTTNKDQWTYGWSAHGFSTSKTYLSLVDHIQIAPTFN